jgi:hypothetical protein
MLGAQGARYRLPSDQLLGHDSMGRGPAEQRHRPVTDEAVWLTNEIACHGADNRNHKATRGDTEEVKRRGRRAGVETDLQTLRNRLTSAQLDEMHTTSNRKDGTSWPKSL